MSVCISTFVILPSITSILHLVLDIEYGLTITEKADHFNLSRTTTESVPNYGIRLNLAMAQSLLGILLLFELIIKWILDFRVGNLYGFLYYASLYLTMSSVLEG